MQQYMRSAKTVSRVIINRFKKIKICKHVSLVIGIIPDKKMYISIFCIFRSYFKKYMEINNHV